MTKKLLFVTLFCICRCDKFLLEPFDKAGEVPCDIDGGEPCGVNEVCIAEQNTARFGQCKCASGFTMEDGLCVSIEENDVHSKNNSIMFEIEGPSTIHLPMSFVDFRVLLDTKEKNHNYKIHWDLVRGNGLASSLSYNDEVLHLTNLLEGTLEFRVTVLSSTRSGQKEFVLHVLPAEKENIPPKAIIRPESPVRGVEGNQIVLDAEGSSDDKPIASYKWSQDNGPSVNLPALDTPVLKLDNLVKGVYTFSVVVFDGNHLSSNASVKVIIEEERDDPPKSIITLCGSTSTGSITVRLPFPDLKLCGNSSTDDKGIVSFSWYRVDKLTEKLTVDSAGSSTNILVLTNVQANEKLGPYEFQLDVSDSKGQKDSSRMTIFVNKADNLPPVIKSGSNRTIYLPDTSLVLEAFVKDDGSIVSYEWSQINGPNIAVISNKNKAKSTISGLIEGAYTFQFDVVDDGGLKAFDKINVYVQRGNNEHPIAIASNVTIRLPLAVAILNGSLSTDDAGIVSYMWEPSESVPAQMIILDNSDTKPVLFITGLVKGHHLYTLTVKDQQKAENSTVVSLDVEQGAEDLESVELFLEKTLKWNHRMRSKLQSRIEAVISSAIPEITTVDVHFSSFVESFNGFLRAVFWITTDQAKRLKRNIPFTQDSVMIASEAVTILEQEWSMFSEFKIISVQTLYCKLNCSGHGKCSDLSKECICDRFWMPNFYSFLFNGLRKYDCSWSSLYVFMLLLFTLIVSISWVLTKKRVIWFGRITKRRFRRKKRYSVLRTDSDDEKGIRRGRNEPRLMPLPVPSSSDSYNSESDELLRGPNWKESNN